MKLEVGDLVVCTSIGSMAMFISEGKFKEYGTCSWIFKNKELKTFSASTNSMLLDSFVLKKGSYNMDTIKVLFGGQSV